MYINDMEHEALSFWVHDITGKSGTIPRYSLDWGAMGPIIEKEEITLQSHEGEWSAYLDDSVAHHYLPLVAACRVLIRAKLGDFVTPKCRVIELRTV